MPVYDPHPLRRLSLRVRSPIGINMWCATCNADVAAEISAETGTVRCASCSTELAQADAIRERTRDAQAILRRWSDQNLLEPLPQTPAATSAPEPAGQAEPTASTTAEKRSPLSVRSPATFRIDPPATANDVSQTGSTRVRAHRKPGIRYADGPHGNQLAGPHFETAPIKRSGWAVAAGQWLAYLGVLGLTVGTAVVVYGHFGGDSSYTPTGWLITTVGQMLLFLGVINLVSGGMEQSNDEVSQRIEILGEQLLRIEAATDEVLQGPRIPAHRYAEGEVARGESARTESVVE